MVLQGPPPPVGGSQPASPSLLRSSNNVMPAQNAFPSSVSPRSQYNNMNMLGNNGPNVSSLFDQSFGNGAGLSVNNGPNEPVPLSSAGNGMGFIAPSSPYMSSSIAVNPYSSGQVQVQGQSQGQGQQFPSPSEHQTFQHNQQQFSMPAISQQSQQYQVMRPGLGGIKMGQQTGNDQSSQQLQALRNIGSSVKMEPQQLQGMRGNMGPAKLEPQYSDSSLFLQQHKQQQQQLMLARQSPQAAAIFHQQRFLQMQQQQQQQLFKAAMPQQRPQQFQQQNLAIRSSAKPVYEPGMCARRLTHYMYQQQHRPEENSIDYWRTFVAEFFAPNAKKKWCVSMYGIGRQTNGVFPQDVWHCEICNRKPARGFEATAEVLPRLFKIKYESGTLEELLYVDMPREYQNPAGQIVLDYAKAIQESVFEQLRVVRDGQLRIVFSPDLKICSWEFCARRHEELIPRRLLIPQVSQLGAAAQKYQASTQITSPGPSTSELQNNCNMFVASARQLAKSLEVPLVNDLGYTKRYVRCLQISEVVNNLKDLIDYSSETGAGPMESLAKYPRRTNPSPSSFRSQSQQPDIQQQQMGQNPNNDNPVPPSNTNNPINSTNTTPNLVHQNSINSRPQNQPMPNPNPSYGTNGVPMPSPTAALSNNNIPKPASHTTLPRVNSPNITMQQQQQQPASGDSDGNDTQSSVQKIIQDMMMSSQLGGDARNGNGIMSANGNMGINGGSNNNILMGTGVVNGLGQPPPVLSDIRSAFANNHSVSMNGRAVGMNNSQQQQQQQDMSHQLLDGIGSVNGFNNLQFDWKNSP